MIYVRIKRDNQYYTRLLTSKTRLAPTQQISLPRLELNEVFLISKLIKVAQNSLNISDDKISVWSDSTKYERKHPIIIPRGAHQSKLLTRDAHKNTIHGGIQLTLAY